jgi:uncharacterized protein YdeI (YjbR/CyaY-like superfamily)
MMGSFNPAERVRFHFEERDHFRIMKTGETLEVAPREEFHRRPNRFHKIRSEIWLVYYYKQTGKQGIG